MNVTDLFLGCFAFGLLWSLASILLGGFHLHSHAAHTPHGFHLHSHTSHGAHGTGTHASSSHSSWSQSFLNVNTFAIFLAWMGGSGYLMMRHTRFGLWIVLAIAMVVGLGGGAALAAVLRFLQMREFVMDAADYEMVGVLGRISSPIRQGGTGEMIFSRDGGRKLACVRSDNENPIDRDQEVVVTSYRNGIAYVRTWAALTGEVQPTHFGLKDPGIGAEDAPPAHH